MPNSQSLPTRGITLDTDNPDELTKIQPERQRSFVQLQRGPLSFKVRELVWGDAGIQSERWTCGLRMQLGRHSSYVSFAFITQARARWMGVPIGPGSVLRIVGPWECVSDGALEFVAFAVSRSAFEAAALLVRDPDQYEMPCENRAGRRNDAVLLAMRLFRDLHALQSRVSHRAALSAAPHPGSWSLLESSTRHQSQPAWPPPPPPRAPCGPPLNFKKPPPPKIPN